MVVLSSGSRSCAALVFCMFALLVASPQVFSGPISTCAQLQGMNSNLGASYWLTGDINCSATRTWNGGLGFVPVGNTTTNFSGAFDGNGFRISGLYINRPLESRVGLFGVIAGNSISNLALVDMNITGDKYVGGIAGENIHGVIADSSSSGVIKGTDYVGGILGKNDFYGSISRSSSAANVFGSTCVGGLVGWFKIGSISQSYSAGPVRGTYSAGGLVGLGLGSSSYTSQITNSYSVGSIDCLSAPNCGGFIGFASGCFISIVNSYSARSVSGIGFKFAGAYPAGTGGIPGLPDCPPSNSFYDSSLPGSVNQYAVGKTNLEMKTKAIFTDATWDFASIWDMNSLVNQGYPFLRWGYSLALAKSGGAASGTIASNPSGINCGTACTSASSNFNSAASVTLTATPSPGYSFSGWSGACSGTGACSVLMTKARSVTAAFIAIPVDGNCGLSVDSCTQGAFSDRPDSLDYYLWDCNGSGGGISSSCSLLIAAPTPGACGPAAKPYDYNELFPGGAYCSPAATAPVPSLPADPAAGSSSSWACNGANDGAPASCSASRASAPAPPENSIISLSASYDGNINLQMSCSIGTVGGVLGIYNANSEQVGSASGVPCGPSGNSFALPNFSFESGKVYQIVLTIPSPCRVCQKEAFIVGGSSSQPQGTSIPDNSPLLAVAVSLLAALFVLATSRKKK